MSGSPNSPDSGLNVCSWESYLPLLMEAYGASEEKSVLANASVLPDAFLAKLANRTVAPENVHLQFYRNVMGRIRALIENNQVRFVFLHLPISPSKGHL